ncbi:MAG TPA: NADP(H)-dependent aldo-keto reductase [Povalibacter sp.]|uniref:NADP(H)-dependent aldo-keto reductase n=1 Tax=Povalibacter sp. TaxID=1962978 RepID=UPI002BF19D3E|nr:NADP(H)-dependent aldo-keto reductase [Povalibacter sp.]HMN43978.1 NADP(H)-dependent aldo-keto reductase [Povalibacter sp.]
MEYRQLGRTDIKVSVIGLGTMTFGEQNTEAEGHAQLDYALDHGVNLIDTAEMYSVPPRAETYGSTERIIGAWLKRSGKRDKIVLATKVAGPTHVLKIDHVRGGKTGLDRKNILAAVEGSLQRLQTDYVDLYQLHWPDRSTNFFGRMGYRHMEDEQSVPVEETLDALTDLVASGKVRHIGLSNETPWGLHQFLRVAEQRKLARIVSIQNPYNLLNRTFEVGLAEMAIRERVGLLAYSPLAFGMLSGKFLNGARPPEARVVRFPRFSRYNGDIAERTTAAYVDIARRHAFDPSQMALAFVNRQRFLTSNLIGATTLAQLKTNLGSAELKLSDEVMQAIEAVHRAQANPCP